MRTEDVDNESASDNNYIFDIDCLQTIRGLGGREVLFSTLTLYFMCCFLYPIDFLLHWLSNSSCWSFKLRQLMPARFGLAIAFHNPWLQIVPNSVNG